MKTLEQTIKEEAFGNGKDGQYPPLAACIRTLGHITLATLIRQYEHNLDAEISALHIKIEKLEKIINYLERNK